jgi:hypothetical protein
MSLLYSIEHALPHFMATAQRLDKRYLMLNHVPLRQAAACPSDNCVAPRWRYSRNFHRAVLFVAPWHLGHKSAGILSPVGALSHCDHALDEAGGRAKASEQPRMTAGLSGASERVVVR